MLGNGIFSVFGAGLNAAMSSGATNEQWGSQLKLMDIQNRYNEQMAKNNQNSTQKTEQTTTSSVDSTKININPKY